MVTDLGKINKFCSQITKTGYPDALKNLKGISKETTKSLLQVIDKFRHKYNPNDSIWVECELIRRFLKPSSFIEKTIRKVQGPVSVYELSHKKYPQIFYLFGDRHFIQQSACPEDGKIDQYIKDTISNSPVFIDVYLEKTYRHEKYFFSEWMPDERDKSGQKGYMDETIKTFDSCFSKYKEFAPCRTSRFHYSDPRFFFETKSQLRGYNLIDTLTPGGFNRGITKQESLDVANFIEYIKDDNSLIHRRIKKQIKNILDLGIQKTIENLYKEKCRGCFKDIRTPNQGDPDEKVSEFIKDAKLETRILARLCIMDYYLIARCFRSYDKKKGYSRPSYNNIVQAGYQHIINYVDILQKLGFTIKYKNVNVGKNRRPIKRRFQCIDIEKMKQPLFHQRYK